MAYTPRATRGRQNLELEEGTRREMSHSKMSYATGYLLKIGRDAMFESPMRGSHSPATLLSRSPLSDRTASPIRLKFGRRSPTSPLQDLCWGDGWEDGSENNQHDTASVVAALAKSRKRKTALTYPLAGEENLQLLTTGMDQPSSKRRKQEVEQEEEEAGVGRSTRRSAFLPVSQSAQMDADTQSGDTPSSSLNASVSESSLVTVEDHSEQNAHVAAQQQCTIPSWHKLSTPPVTQWKKLTLPSSLQEEERSTEALAPKQDDHVAKSVYGGSSAESEHTRKEGGAVSVRTNTIRLPDILTDTDSVSSTDEQTSTYTSRTSTPALDSSLQPSPISPTPKQQLLMRLRRRYTSGLSPAPVESWDSFKNRLLSKEDEPRPVFSAKRQISREDMKKDHVRALTRVRSYLRQFSEEEQQQQKAEEEQRKKKEENAKSSSLATVAVASSQPSTSALPPATASVPSLGVAQNQSTVDSGLKLPGLTLPTVGDSGGLLSSSSASGMNASLAVPPLGASSQPGSTSLTLGGTSVSVSVPTGLSGTAVGVGSSQPKVSSTAGGMSSLLLNPLQSSSLLGNVSTSSSQPLSGIKLGSSVPSTAAPLASSLQLGASNATTVTPFTLPTVTAQSSNGMNLQFNSIVDTGRQSVPTATAASGGPAPLSFATALGQPLKGTSNSVLGSGLQLPQVGASVGLGQGSILPPSTSTASFSTLSASFSFASTGGLFDQPGHTVVSSSTTTNPTGSLFGASSSFGLLGPQQSNGQTVAAQPQPSLFATPAQGGLPSQSMGLSLFGGSKQVSSSAQGSMQSQGGSIFGAVQSDKGSLFASSNQGNNLQGLFASSSVSQAGSILSTTQAFGVGGQGVQQSAPLLGGSVPQQSTSSLFGAQSNPSSLSASIFGNMNPSNGQSGPLPFNGKSLSGAAMGTPPTFNFAAQSTSATSTLSQLGNRTGNSTSFQQPTQPLTFSATPQINFSATSGFNTPPLGGNTALPTPASGRRPIAKAGRRIKRN